MGDLADTYESVYDLRRRGHLMPKDGDWLQGDRSRSRLAAAAPTPRGRADARAVSGRYSTSAERPAASQSPPEYPRGAGVFNAEKSVDAALIRERASGGRRSDREVLESIMSEIEYCEARGLQRGALPAWRAEVERRLRK
jgi:hypothetical protein